MAGKFVVFIAGTLSKFNIKAASGALQYTRTLFNLLFVLLLDGIASLGKTVRFRPTAPLPRILPVNRLRADEKKNIQWYFVVHFSGQTGIVYAFAAYFSPGILI